MSTPTQGASGYYVWEAEGSSFEVHVSLDVIESLGSEIMRGFGAVPKRGAEVGGLLIGSIEQGSTTVVRIEDFQPVPCGYTRGPSYLLSFEERSAFEEAAQALSPQPGETSYAVGYFRSHTRDGLALAPEDTDLMDRCFPEASNVVLLVKPYATKASTAGFFFREDGTFQATTPLEFPFRRRELTGEEPPERRPLTDRSNRVRRTPSVVPQDEPPSNEPAREDFQPQESSDAVGHAYAITTPARSRLGGWMWIPLSFVFLLLGVALGYLAALNVSPRGALTGASDYSLALSVQKAGDTLSVQWNGDAPAIRNADRGVLEIRDGGFTKAVDLDAAQLRGGRVAFHNASNTVSFRLTVYLNSRLSITESQDWRQ